MELSALMAFLHHIAAFTLVGAVMTELVLLRCELTLQSARALLRVDFFYGMAALALLVIGPLRVMFFEKGPMYYLHSIPFLVKICAFAAMGVISIVPTGTFLSWRAGLKDGIIPVVPAARIRRLRLILHLELTAIVIIIACAALMARGIGSQYVLG